MYIRPIKSTEWTDAMALSWRTFLKFEGTDYTPEGVKSFYKFVTSTDLEKMFLIGEYKAFGAFDNEVLVGIAGLRSQTFLSILFVDEHYHRMGIGKSLVGYVIQHLKSTMQTGRLTVNSSPYAVGFYHRLGFKDIDKTREKNGVIYTSMMLDF